MEIKNLIGKLKLAWAPSFQDGGLLKASDLAIDLGSSNTRIYAAGQGIVLDEPSVIAINETKGNLIAAGRAAKLMAWREPLHVNIIHPIREGAIANLDAAKQMISCFLDRAMSKWTYLGPHILMCISGEVTAVERRTFEDLAYDVGARKIELLEEPFAAAVAIRAMRQSERASMIIDIGGGTVDVAVYTWNGLIRSSTLRGGGNEVDQLLIQYFRREYGIEIGECTAEEAKIKFSSITSDNGQLEISARNVTTGLPETVVITIDEFQEAINPMIRKVIRHVRSILEELPTQIATDVFDTGVILTGGGARLAGLSQSLTEELKLKVWVASDPMLVVVRGAGSLIEQAHESPVLSANQLPLLASQNRDREVAYLLSSSPIADNLSQGEDKNEEKDEG